MRYGYCHVSSIGAIMVRWSRTSEYTEARCTLGLREFTISDSIDNALSELERLYDEAYQADETEYRTDVFTLGLVIGTLFGMFGSYIVNQLPTLKDAKGAFNRKQLQQIEEIVRNARFELDIDRDRAAMVERVSASLPKHPRSRELAELAVNVVLKHLKPHP